jgi:hypothetical protein
MTFNYCDHCKEVTEGIPEDIDIKGTATESDLELPGHNEAEIHILLPGDEVYHYFDDETTLYKIAGERIIKSYAKLACQTCLANSINTDLPHYGDGAYATANGSLIPKEKENPSSIIRAHGIYYWEKRVFRAVIRINNPKGFKKYYQTGGVVRSIPQNGVSIKRGEFISHSIDDGEVIRFEKWNGTDWEYYEGCCF